MSLKLKLFTQQNIIKKIYQYFHREAKRGSLYYSISNLKKRTMRVLRLSKRSFHRLVNDVTNECSRNERNRRRKCMLDSFDREFVRREICKMFDSGKEVTLRKLKIWLKKNNSIDVSKTTFWSSVRGLGFTLRKYSCGRNIICQKPNLVPARRKHISAVKEIRNAGYDIVYSDETWINGHHTNGKNDSHNTEELKSMYLAAMESD
jgi:hypothetical protein